MPFSVKVMVQKLLADRFSLAFHREMKELEVYAVALLSNRRHKLTR